jgi:hypothetical protein
MPKIVYNWAIANSNGINTMPKPESLRAAHDYLKDSLNEWARAKETLEEEKDWPERNDFLYDDIYRKMVVAFHAIYKFIGDLSKSVDSVSLLSKSINYASEDIIDAVDHGTDAMLDDYNLPSSVLASWKMVCGHVQLFARFACAKLIRVRSTYRKQMTSHYERLFRDAINGLMQMDYIAAKCRKRLSYRSNLED